MKDYGSIRESAQRPRGRGLERSSDRCYDRVAQLYDLEHRDWLEDIELYRNFSLRCDGPVLELGCGSGRVCLALARAGVHVTGVDTSEAMLSLARARAADAELSARLRLEQADVRALALEREFALVIFPLNGFLHLLAPEDQLATLACAHRALLPGGFLIVDLPNPYVVFTPDADGEFLLRRRFSSPEGHAIASYTCSRTDLAAQRQHLALRYDEMEGDTPIQRTTVEMDLRFVYRYEMEALLRQVGFELDAVYGSYDLDPYETDSHVMVFVAYRPLTSDR
jgi:SAM-dependent methyltransferase